MNVKKAMTFEDAKKKLLEKFPESRVAFACETKELFIMSLLKKGVTLDSSVDSFHSIDKKTGKIKEYLPHMHRQEFNDAVKNHTLYDEDS